MQEIWGEHAPDVANIKLQDGTNLGDSIWFVKGLGALARSASDAGILEIGDGAVTVSRDQRLDELYNLKVSDQKRYQSKGVHDEIYRLEASKLKKGGGR